MRLRPVAAADLEIIRQLRNANRESFLYDSEVSVEQHAAWFRAIADKPINFYVIEEDGLVVGTISTTRSDEGIEVGNLTLERAARGKGLMRQAVGELTARPGHYFAEVKSGNAPSLAVFDATGFKIVSGGQVLRLSKDV